jgi:hypothetical protein
MATRTLDFWKLGWSQRSLSQQKKLVLEYGLGATDRSGEGFWHQALFERRRSGLALAKWLISQGHDPKQPTHRGPALHVAACRGNVETVDWLLSLGVPAQQTHHGASALDAMLSSASNADLESVLPIAKRLLEAGAKVTPAGRRAVLALATSFEAAHEAMGRAFRVRGEKAVRELCSLFEVAVPAPMVRHDGTTPIRLPKGPPAKQFKALWEFLVPASGAAKTVQGEVIRIAGRLRHELDSTGGVNWDAEYQKMAQAFPTLLAMGTPLDAEHLGSLRAQMKTLRRTRETDPLAPAALEWIRKNPTPLSLGTVPYRR